MPELPEVETIARQLRARGIEGKTIRAVRVDWPRAVEPLSVVAFRRRLEGERIETVGRVGKWLMLGLGSGRTLMVHLRMSGGFSMEPGTHDRIVLGFSDGSALHYRDPRKFGRWRLVDDPAEVLGPLGPDALSDGFTQNCFRDALRAHRRMIKPLLLDQSVVAGLGNIYADEALWLAKIHPERSSDSLDASEEAALFRAIRQVLSISVSNGGTSLGEGRSNYRDVAGASGGHRAQVKVYGRGGRPCERCGTSIEKSVVAQRGTHFCPACQRK